MRRLPTPSRSLLETLVDRVVYRRLSYKGEFWTHCLRGAMRICFLSSTHPPLDKRVFSKEAVTLAKQGFDVVHLAPDDLASEWMQSGVRITTYTKPNSFMERVLQIPRLYRLAVKINADCYHCNEVDSWFVGILLKLIMRRKVIFDVHELYPIRLAESRFPRWLHPFVVCVVRLVFRVLSLSTDEFVFANEFVAHDFPASKGREVLVRNFASLASRFVKTQAGTDPDLKASEVVVTAIHNGLINRLRGWPQLLEALARSRWKYLNLRIVGTFNDGSQADFERCVAELGLEGRVKVEGWMPFEQVYKRLLSSDIGLILFQPGVQNHVYGLPHKLFDYMLAGLPVIAPDFAVAMAPIIKQADCGILVNPSKSDEIAEALDYLVVHIDERRRLGENGRRAILERYNWETEADKLVNMYLRIRDSV